MKKSIKKIDKEFRQHWKNYALQSILATVAIFIVLYLLSLEHVVIIASIGATTFIIFAMPDNITAQSRNVIGGHCSQCCCKRYHLRGACCDCRQYNPVVGHSCVF